MRRRIISGTGLGNPDKVILDNKGKVNEDMAEDAINTFFRKWHGFDFKIEKDQILLGIEPSYQYDPLKIVCINRNKEDSYIQIGTAMGGYGSDILKTTKYYKQHKKSSKVTWFIDKWHEVLYGN